VVTKANFYAEEFVKQCLKIYFFPRVEPQSLMFLDKRDNEVNRLMMSNFSQRILDFIFNFVVDIIEHSTDQAIATVQKFILMLGEKLVGGSTSIHTIRFAKCINV
jgi:hypothetical protein